MKGSTFVAEKTRKPIPTDVQTAVLANGARRCVLCFHLGGDLAEKHGQIAHIDQDPSNASEDNLAFMCLPHHSLYDSKTRQHKNYTLGEVKLARSNLYQLVANGGHLGNAGPSTSIEADRRILREFLEAVPSDRTMGFLKEQHFADTFDWKHLADIQRLLREKHGPEHEFLDADLEVARLHFHDDCRKFLRVLTTYTFPGPGDKHSIPKEWREQKPELLTKAVEEIHAAVERVCESYQSLVRASRRRLGA